MTFARRVALATIVAPLTLALAACGGTEADDGTIAQAEAIAPIPAPAGTTWSEKTVVTPESGYLMGNPDAPIKLVEYGSLTCPGCAAFSAEASEELQAEYINSGRVSFEFRSFMIHGAPDMVLTRLAECGSPEAVIPLADQIWANIGTLVPAFQAAGQAGEQAMSLPPEQRFVAFADAANIYDFFAARGISRDQARTCLADTKAIERLANASQQNAEKDQVGGTPTFFVNGKRIDTNSWAGLEPVLQRAGAR